MTANRVIIETDGLEVVVSVFKSRVFMDFKVKGEGIQIKSIGFSRLQANDLSDALAELAKGIRKQI